jgi:glucokinase
VKKKQASMILAGDIGGTNTRLALYEVKRGIRKVAEGRFLSKNYPNLLPIIQAFLKQHDSLRPTRAAFGIAGVVREGRCQATNLPWFVDVRDLERELPLSSVSLLNDLEANAWGLRALKPHDFFLLHKGESKCRGNAALIAAGTGLGEAGLFWDGRRHHPFATEGGHTDFGPRNDLEIELLLYLRKIYPHVSYERIISGAGLYHIYQFLVVSGVERESQEVQSDMAQKDPPTVISDWGRRKRDAACARAVDWFISLYGAEAGNLALKIMSIGGLYVSGKIAMILAENIKQGGFVQSFIDKGRFSHLLKAMPVFLVLNEEAPLLGAVEYARKRYAIL